MTGTYKVEYSHGITESFDSYDKAVEAIRAVYTDPVIGHDGDITEGGERTLCWRTEEEAEDDGGYNFCCVIRYMHD